MDRKFPDDNVFKKTAHILYETAEWGPKREWATLPDSAKLTWWIAAKRAFIAAEAISGLRPPADNLMGDDDIIDAITPRGINEQ